jgi:hypothetical protein
MRATGHPPNRTRAKALAGAPRYTRLPSREGKLRLLLYTLVPTCPAARGEGGGGAVASRELHWDVPSALRQQRARSVTHLCRSAQTPAARGKEGGGRVARAARGRAWLAALLTRRLLHTLVLPCTDPRCPWWGWGRLLLASCTGTCPARCDRTPAVRGWVSRPVLRTRSTRW